jgi:hypothetical protein
MRSRPFNLPEKGGLSINPPYRDRTDSVREGRNPRLEKEKAKPDQ